LPALAMTTSVPRLTSSSKRERWGLASCTFTYFELTFYSSRTSWGFTLDGLTHALAEPYLPNSLCAECIVFGGFPQPNPWPLPLRDWLGSFPHNSALLVHKVPTQNNGWIYLLDALIPSSETTRRAQNRHAFLPMITDKVRLFSNLTNGEIAVCNDGIQLLTRLGTRV
jgi:hypothetical protein